MSKLITGMKSVSDFLNDALKAVENQDIVKAVVKAAPWWAGALGDAAKEALPLGGFVLKYAERLAQETDPEKQGYTACTLAYSRAVEQAVQAQQLQLNRPHQGFEKTATQIQKQMSDDIDIGGFA